MLEAIITIVGIKNPRDMRNQLYEIPEGVDADQFGAQLPYKIKLNFMHLPFLSLKLLFLT